ncbi:hypothetical protein LTR86_004287 [Recurvomyces mirabilis]|nr:hypothetical protein LTR86_004287 [Recurvomyces mirabilis]
MTHENEFWPQLGWAAYPVDDNSIGPTVDDSVDLYFDNHVGTSIPNIDVPDYHDLAIVDLPWTNVNVAPNLGRPSTRRRNPPRFPLEVEFADDSVLLLATTPSVNTDSSPSTIILSNRTLLRFRCALCKYHPKNESDAKIHAFRHIKPFACVDGDCNKSFASATDMSRHRRSVHHHRSESDASTSRTKWHFCPVLDCPGGGNPWPRLDNLRNHIRRKHPEFDLSSYTRQPSRTRTSNGEGSNVDVPDHAVLMTGVNGYALDSPIWIDD